MRNPLTPVLVVGAIVCLMSDVGAADLTVLVKGIESEKGGVAFSLFSAKEGYPVDEKKAVATRYVEKIEGKADAYFVKTVFAGLKSGPIAVAVFHDEDGNKKLTQGFLGIPTEGTGASRDAKGVMGPPSFEDAVFELKGNQAIEINL